MPPSPSATSGSPGADAPGSDVPDANVPAGPPGFEAALTELEGIVGRMESGELSLEDALSAYKRGAELLQYCQAALKDAQQQVKILEAGLLQDFAGGGEQD